MTSAIEHHEQALAERALYMPKISLFARRIGSTRLYVLAGREERALELLKTLEQEISPPWDQLLPLGYLYVYLELGDTEKAAEQLPHLEKATTVPYLRGVRAAIGRGRGGVAELQGQHASAVDHYREAVDLAPTNEYLRFRLARCYRRWGHFREAEAELGQVLRTSPVHPEAHLEMARVCHELGRSDEAMEHLGTALSVWQEADPQYRPAQEARGLHQAWSRST